MVVFDSARHAGGRQHQSNSPARSGGMYIIFLFGGAPRQCPWASKAFHGYFDGIPRATADALRATADTPRASTDTPRASTMECRGKYRNTVEAHGISRGNFHSIHHGKVHGNLHGNPRQASTAYHGRPRCTTERSTAMPTTWGWPWHMPWQLPWYFCRLPWLVPQRLPRTEPRHVPWPQPWNLPWKRHVQRKAVALAVETRGFPR